MPLFDTILNTRFAEYTSQKLDLINNNHIVDPACYIVPTSIAVPDESRDAAADIVLEPPFDSYVEAITIRKSKVIWDQTPQTMSSALPSTMPCL